jgi:hypothetical protein
MDLDSSSNIAIGGKSASIDIVSVATSPIVVFYDLNGIIKWAK